MGFHPEDIKFQRVHVTPFTHPSGSTTSAPPFIEEEDGVRPSHPMTPMGITGP